MSKETQTRLMGKRLLRCGTGGTILLFHVHPVSNFNYLGRFNQPYITEGITAILIRVTYLLNELGTVRRRRWRFALSVLVILMAL